MLPIILNILLSIQNLLYKRGGSREIEQPKNLNLNHSRDFDLIIFL